MDPNNTTPATGAADVPRATGHEPRNFLVTFLLAVMFGQLGLRHFYTGEKKLGWIRLGLVIGGILWTFVFALAGLGLLSSLGSLALIVAGIWSIVDFFAVYLSVRKDADGQDLIITKRDKTWAKAIFWSIIVAIVLYVLFFFTIMSIALNSAQDMTNGFYTSTSQSTTSSKSF